MNSTTKKFLSAILTTAIVFTQAGATVSAATSSTWGTSTSQTTQSTSTKTTSKDYGNSSYWSEKDKYGYAYPYSYYYYASDPTVKKIYVQVYEALHDRKPTISISETTYRALNKSSNVSVATLIKEICYECPELYYADYRECKNKGEGANKKVVFYIDYLPEKTIASYEKTFAKVLEDFDAYLEKNNVTTTKQFLDCGVSYIGKHVSYDKTTKNCNSIVGAFVNGKAKCEGYVQAFNYLCRTHGISSAYKSADSDEGSHALSSVIYKNIWYNFDPTAYKWSDRQMTTDAQVKEYGFTVDTNGTFGNIKCKSPVCNGKAVKPPVAKTTASTSKPSTSTQTKPTNDTAEETFIEYHYKDFDTFSFIVKGNIKGKRNKGYTYYKITVPDGKLDLTIKYLKKMKADGTITYKSLSKGKNYVKITL